jgi:D-arabinose 1-dehydrogenase-like Zn-dependent alcohol dehydrogenase
MRAAVLAEPGGPDAVAVTDLSRPVCEPDEVLVAVSTVGANQLDLNTMRGLGPGAEHRFPLVPGIDPAGTVVEQGADVSRDRVGERVVVKPNIACGRCRYCRAGQEADCVAQTVVGVHRQGGAAEYVAVPARNAYPIADLPFEVATAAVHSVPIALHALRAVGDVEAGSTVLVTGARGAVGSAAVQLARRAGATVLAASRTDPPDGLGDDVVPVSYGGAEGLAAAVADHVVDVAVDCTGHGDVIAASLRCLGWKGRLAICSGSLQSAMAVDARDLYLRRKTVVGSASADYAEVSEALALVADGSVVARVGASFALADIGAAFAALSAPGRHGKVVVHVR